MRPRLLLLHGYGQTAESFRKKSHVLQKALGRTYELVYLEGPHSVTNPQGEPGRAWWTFEGDFFTTPTYHGIEESLALVNNELPFVGIVGFSQGAAFAAILSSRFQLDFSIIIGGYPVSDLRYRNYSQIQSRTIHVYGTEDSIVTPDRSKQLHDLCSGQKQLVEHSGRHVVPRLKYQQLLD